MQSIQIPIRLSIVFCLLAACPGPADSKSEKSSKIEGSGTTEGRIRTYAEPCKFLLKLKVAEFYKKYKHCTVEASNQTAEKHCKSLLEHLRGNCGTIPDAVSAINELEQKLRLLVNCRRGIIDSPYIIKQLKEETTKIKMSIARERMKKSPIRYTQIWTDPRPTADEQTRQRLGEPLEHQGSR